MQILPRGGFAWGGLWSVQLLKTWVTAQCHLQREKVHLSHLSTVVLNSLLGRACVKAFFGSICQSGSAHSLPPPAAPFPLGNSLP